MDGWITFLVTPLTDHKHNNRLGEPGRLAGARLPEPLRRNKKPVSRRRTKNVILLVSLAFSFYTVR